MTDAERAHCARQDHRDWARAESTAAFEAELAWLASLGPSGSAWVVEAIRDRQAAHRARHGAARAHCEPVAHGCALASAIAACEAALRDLRALRDCG